MLPRQMTSSRPGPSYHVCDVRKPASQIGQKNDKFPSRPPASPPKPAKLPLFRELLSWAVLVAPAVAPGPPFARPSLP